MTDALNPIPSAQPGDSDDVELALEAAQRMHRTGDVGEALKWLRRAVGAADEAGDDRRQLELARAAADYTSYASSTALAPSAPVEVPPAAKPAPASVAPAQAVAQSVAPSHSRLPQAPAKQPPLAPSARASMTPTATSVAPMTATAGSPPPLPGQSRAPAPSASVAPRAPVAQSVPQAKNKLTDSRMPPAPKAPSAHAQPDEHLTPARVGASVTPKPSTATGSVLPPQAAAPASESPSGMHNAHLPTGSLRVAVRVSARDEKLYVARPLSPGQRVPVGCQEAWLVFDETLAAGAGAPLKSAE